MDAWGKKILDDLMILCLNGHRGQLGVRWPAKLVVPWPEVKAGAEMNQRAATTNQLEG